jgi:diguanylate cyclase (GGDEF)-like protein
LLLKEAAGLIMGTIRAYDNIAESYGGKDLLAILLGTDFENTFTLAERVRKNIADRLNKKAGVPIKSPVTVSIGIPSSSVDDLSANDLILRANNGLYTAKQEGRNRIAWSRYKLGRLRGKKPGAEIPLSPVGNDHDHHLSRTQLLGNPQRSPHCGP